MRMVVKGATFMGSELAAHNWKRADRQAWSTTAAREPEYNETMREGT